MSAKRNSLKTTILKRFGCISKLLPDAVGIKAFRLVKPGWRRRTTRKPPLLWKTCNWEWKKLELSERKKEETSENPSIVVGIKTLTWNCGRATRKLRKASKCRSPGRFYKYSSNSTCFFLVVVWMVVEKLGTVEVWWP